MTAGHSSIDPPGPDCSVVIPVFNSERLVPRTVARLHQFFAESALSYEIILVNDGSTDLSWQALVNLVEGDSRVVALDLTRNCGQHFALLCGLREARGTFVITIDDDLQNDAYDIAKLASRAERGHDLVFGRYPQGRYRGPRRYGSGLMRGLVRRLGGGPRNLFVSNFRLLHRDVVERMLVRATARSNVSCLALACARRPADVDVGHWRRPLGASNYTFRRLARLMLNTLIEHADLTGGLRGSAGAAAIAFLGWLGLTLGVVGAPGSRAAEAGRLAASGVGLAALLVLLLLLAARVTRGMTRRPLEEASRIARRCARPPDTSSAGAGPIVLATPGGEPLSAPSRFFRKGRSTAR